MGAPVLPVHPGRPRLTPFTGSDFRGVSSSPHQGGFGLGSGDGSRKCLLSQAQNACLSTPSQVHPATRGVCLSSCPAVSPYGAGRSEPRLLSRLANILHLSDSPTSPPSSPPKWSPRRGSNPHASGHIGQHRRADVLRLSRSGTVQLSHLPPAFHAIGFIPRREMPLAKDPAPPMQY